MDDTRPCTSLLTIPLEVLLLISYHLPIRDYGYLRRTCKHMEISFFSSFAKEFFTKRQFCLTEFSLGALVNIATSRFAPSLRYLIITLDRPHYNVSAKIYDYSGDHARAVKANRSVEEHASHKQLINTGYDVKLLTEALQNLPNLQTISMRDFNSRGRYRDEPHILFHSYGYQTHFEQTGLTLDPPRLGHRSDPADEPCIDYARHVFTVILLTLAEARGSQPSPERLEVILRNSKLPDDAFAIPGYLEAKLVPVLTALKALYLDLGAVGPYVIVGDENKLQAHPFFYLNQFLLKTPSLRHLRLNTHVYNEFRSTDILELFSQGSVVPSAKEEVTLDGQKAIDISLGAAQHQVPRAPPRPSFPHLETLDLGMMRADLEVLLGLFRRYKTTLRSIALHKVCLFGTDDDDGDNKVNLWARLCRQMHGLNLSLTSLRLSSITQKVPGAQGAVTAFFKDKVSDGHYLEREWKGSDTSRGLKDFERNIVIDWPRDADSDESDEDMDGLDSMDSDEVMDILAEEDMSSEDDDDDADADEIAWLSSTNPIWTMPLANNLSQ